MSVSGPPKAPSTIVLPKLPASPEIVPSHSSVGLRVELESGARSLKSQMRRADKLGARYVLILGEDEIAGGAITVRDMDAHTDHPRAIAIDLAADELRAALAAL